MFLRKTSSHIRGLGEFSVQWVYTKKEVSNMEIAYLIPEILQMVDEQKIALTPAVELSFRSNRSFSS